MRRTARPDAQRVVLYEDLNCPFCYALTETLQREGLVRAIAWRGVEHAPEAPVPWAKPGIALKQMLETEVETVKRRLPTLSIGCPTAQPNTGYAIMAIAQAQQKDEELAVELRLRIKRALFQGNRDLSDRALIDRLQREVGFAPAQPDDALVEDVAQWQSAWRAMQPRMIPTMIAPNGTIRLGLGDPAEAVAFVREHVPSLPRPAPTPSSKS